MLERTEFRLRPLVAAVGMLCALPSLAFALAYVALWWGVVRWMDQRGWHVKI